MLALENRLVKSRTACLNQGVVMPGPQRIEVLDKDGIQVVSFRDRLLFDDKTVRETADQLNAALPSGGKPLRLALDFTGVDLISSSLLGKLILLLRRVEGGGGRIILCELSPTVQAVFKTSNLDKLFKVVRDRTAALAEL